MPFVKYLRKFWAFVRQQAYGLQWYSLALKEHGEFSCGEVNVFGRPLIKSRPYFHLFSLFLISRTNLDFDRLGSSPDKEIVVDSTMTTIPHPFHPLPHVSADTTVPPRDHRNLCGTLQYPNESPVGSSLEALIRWQRMGSSIKHPCDPA